MDERVQFIGDYLSGRHAMTELCEAYGVSRQTGYKWLARYRSEGAAGLVERSRAPHVHGRATPASLTQAIIDLRVARPSWGPLKIIGTLSDKQPDLAWPSPSTAGEILKRAGLVSGRKLRRRAPPRLHGLTPPQHANHVWGVDHKGWVRLGDGSRCEPLTITDGFSRYLISVTASRSTSQAQTRPSFQKAFRDYGLPEVIRSDNGSPFASAGVTGLTRLSAWWLKLGIQHERIDPGCPQQNGRHERFHLTLLEAMKPPCRDAVAQQQRFERFKRDYNEERPHQALGQRPPASVYSASPRPMPDRVPEPDYPEGIEVRKVRPTGEIKWRGSYVFVSEALAGEMVALEESDAGFWVTRFYAQPIGRIDPKTRKLCHLAKPEPGQTTHTNP